MASTTVFSESTFKPQIDKWTAQDGATVVLWADPNEILLLRYRADRWGVTRHPAIDASEGSISPAMTWQGVPYAAAGQRVAEFTAGSPNSEWDQFYAECQRRQRLRYRNFLVSSSGGETAMS